MTSENIGAIQVNVKMTDLKPVKQLIGDLANLLEQIELSNFRDENGHNLRDNKAYCDLWQTIDAILEEQE